MLRKLALVLLLLAAVGQAFGQAGTRLQSWVEHAQVHAAAHEHHHDDGGALQPDDAAQGEAVFHLHPDEGASSAAAPPRFATARLPALGAQAPPQWVAPALPTPAPEGPLRPPMFPA